MQSYPSPSIWNCRKELNFLPLKYKSMGKESNFLFSLNAQVSPTWGRSQSPESELSFSTNSSPKMQSYPSPQFYKSFPFYMKGRICPHNAELLQILPHKWIFIIFFFFIFHFMFISFYSFFLNFFFFYFFWVFFFFFFFSKLEILPQRKKFIPQHLGGIIEE